MEGASLGRAEWDISREAEQMVKNQPPPIWVLIPPSCNEASPGNPQGPKSGKAASPGGALPAPSWVLLTCPGTDHPPLLGLQVKVWRLPESGQNFPDGAGLTLGPGGAPVDTLQFHPTADAVLACGAGKRVTVWDLGQQQPLTGRQGCDCP